MVNNIKDNTISEIDAKKCLNTLDIIKNSEVKYRRLIPEQKELLNLFNDLSDVILTDKTLISKEENEYENEHDDIMKMLIHLNEYDEETINQNKKIK